MSKQLKELKPRFLEKMKESFGIVKSACDALRISRQTYYNWCKEDHEFAAACAEIVEERIDFAEACLFKLMKDGDSKAITFFLRTVGRKRGYAEAREITGLNGSPIAVDVGLERIKEELPPSTVDAIIGGIRRTSMADAAPVNPPIRVGLGAPLRKRKKSTK